MNTDNLNYNYKEHWNKVYSKSEINKLGWYEERSLPSLQLIEKCRIDKNKIILDVGSGTTTLIKELIIKGYTNIIANDISKVALVKAKENLNEKEQKHVKWVVDDITAPNHLTETNSIDLWHDRTVLHFLTDQKQRNGYISTLKNLVRKNSYVIIAVFSIDGAKKCSGLDVNNYNHNMIADLLGDEFNLIAHFDYLYKMPSGDERPYIYTLFQRK